MVYIFQLNFNIKKLLRKRICIILVALILPYILNGQDIVKNNNEDTLRFFKANSLAISAAYQNGYIFPTNDFIRGVNLERDTIDSFQAFAFKFTKQTLGDKLWEQIYKYPEYGLGVYLAEFDNPKEIGLPLAIFGYYTAPFHRWERLAFNYELGLGFAFNWNNYSIINIYNNAIGSKNTVYIDLGLKAEYQLTKDFFLDVGFSLTHFSNGRLKAPNYGINTVAPKVSLKYNLNSNEFNFKEDVIPKYECNNEFYISTFYGMKNIIYDSLNIELSEKFEGESFDVVGISVMYNRQISYKSKIGLGIASSYDGSVNTQVAIDDGEIEIEEGPFKDNIQLSIFPSYELVVNKVSVVIQPGFYVYRKKIKNQSSTFYQRIGLKYNFYNDFYIGLNLRAYDFYISDFIEWNIGYSFK